MAIKATRTLGYSYGSPTNTLFLVRNRREYPLMVLDAE